MRPSSSKCFLWRAVLNMLEFQPPLDQFLIGNFYVSQKKQDFSKSPILSEKIILYVWNYWDI